jgi:hypothetical protein
MMLIIFNELGPILAGHFRQFEIESAEIWRDWRVVAAQPRVSNWQQVISQGPNFWMPRAKWMDGRSSQVSDNGICDKRLRASLCRTKRNTVGRGEREPQHQTAFT